MFLRRLYQARIKRQREQHGQERQVPVLAEVLAVVEEERVVHTGLQEVAQETPSTGAEMTAKRRAQGVTSGRGFPVLDAALALLLRD